MAVYRIVWNFYGVQFLRMVDLYYFAGLIFADVSTHAHMYCTIEFFSWAWFSRLGDHLRKLWKLDTLKISRYTVIFSTLSRIRHTIKRHFYARDKLMWICWNGPQALEKFMFFYLCVLAFFMDCNVWCDKNLCGTNICDRHLTCKIRINKSRA